VPLRVYLCVSENDNENERDADLAGSQADPAADPTDPTLAVNPTAAANPAEWLQRRRVLAVLGAITIVAGGGVTAGVAAAYEHGGGSQGAAADAFPRPRAASARPSVRPSPSVSRTPRATASPTPSHTPIATAPQYYVDDAGPHAIALTMDDGPHPVYTPQVLEVLREHGVKATFNMIGEQVGANLSLVREVAAAGHTITNHTWDHADMRRYSDARTLSEIDRCNEALAAAGQQPTIFRAPYGFWTPAIFRSCAARGLRPVAWSVDPDDWDTAHVDTQDIVNNVLDNTHAHSIILEHDGGGVRRNTVAALKIFIPRLLERGYEFVAM
jgi:peptidoglycan/xylan/chitin deacetylase (PgdA/CDA1 family)